MEPDEILRSFVHSLPATIRSLIVAQCCIAFDHFEARPDFDYDTAFDEILEQGRGSWRALQVAKMAGILEVLLLPDEGRQEAYEALAAEQPEIEIFAMTALQAPLQERHRIAALQTLYELREGPLSAEVLRQWWRYLQVKNPSR